MVSGLNFSGEAAAVAGDRASGIYIHIPFCKTRCAYCAFYSTTDGSAETEGHYVDCVCREIEMRRGELTGGINTVYIGGGTPSQLSIASLRRIFDAIERCYGLGSCHEITVEANPDDLTGTYVAGLRSLPITRLSIGIQSFDDRQLRLMRRRHTAAEGVNAVRRCQDAGFRNLSIDLIYCLPGQTSEALQRDIDAALTLGVQHISAYNLSYEPKTPIYNMVERGQIVPLGDDASLMLYRQIVAQLKASGYRHYEISNFCLPGFRSLHNSSYWHGIPYLGIGAAAHSYDGAARREWNISSLSEYMSGIESGTRHFGFEVLGQLEQYNEYVMTGLRTSDGINLVELLRRFGPHLSRHCQRMAAPYLSTDRMKFEDDILRLTESGVFISDTIISDLMAVPGDES